MRQKGFGAIIIILVVAFFVFGVVFFFWPGHPPNQFLKGLLSGKLPQQLQQLTNTQDEAKKLTAHEMSKLLEVEVRSGVDKEDEEKMHEGFKIMDFYLNEWFGRSITEKSRIIIEASKDDSRFVQESGVVIFFYRTLSKDWQLPKQIGAQYNMDIRSRAAAHEYIHLYQINNGCAHTGREREKAKWFLEGEAEWLSYKAMDESGNLPFYFSNGQWSSFLTKQIQGGVKPLQTYEVGENLDTEYPYFTLAIDFLMKDRQIKTLDDFCVNLGKGEEISVAFQNAFGASLEKFYSDFETYY